MSARRARAPRWTAPSGHARVGAVAVASVLMLLAASSASAQIGPCCLPSGGCVETDLYSCAAVAGQFLPGASCDDCADATGACCVPGGCLLLASSASASCPAIGGTWLGAGTSCVDCLETPETCGQEDSPSCFRESEVAGCNDETCCTLVCALDEFCCSVSWDATCADLATVVCGPAADAAPAPLLGFSVARGILLSGSTDSLLESDNDRVRVRSELLPQEPIRHVVDFRVLVESPVDVIARLDVTTESGANADEVDTRIYLRDYNQNRWRRIDRYVQTTVDIERLILDVHRPNRFVNAGGQMLLRIYMRRSTTFVGRFDLAALGAVAAE